MTRTSRRTMAALLPLLLLVGACNGDDPEAADGPGPGDATTTTVAPGGADGSTTSTEAGAPTTATTASDSTPRTSSPPAAAGGDAAGVIELSIVGGNAEGGVRRETVKQGAQVTIRTTSDTADELHLHTYDLAVDLVPGQSADLTFLARIPGVFEVELEKRHKKVLELEVRP